MNDIEAVRPRRLSISDKYSANLYRYARKWKDWGIDAYASDRNLLCEPCPFDFDNPVPGRIVIGRKDEDGWLSGSRLNSILTSRNAERWAFMPVDAKHYTDVSQWFWPEYLRIGRALWDPLGILSMQGDDGRWEYRGDKFRVCQWSGRTYAARTVVRHREPVIRTVWDKINDNAATDTQVYAAA